MNLNAQLLASLIRLNCDAYLSGQRDRAEWDAEQRRLWAAAMRSEVDKEVLALVMPTLAGAR